MEKPPFYWPEGREVLYLSTDSPIMVLAREYALDHSSDKKVKTGSVVFRDEAVLGFAANYSAYHIENNICERVRLGCASGTGYELCPGCSWENHSERQAINDAIKKGHNLAGASLALWGHYWACEHCWERILEAGIKDVYLLEDSFTLFNSENPNNILGRQMEIYRATIQQS